MTKPYERHDRNLPVRKKLEIEARRLREGIGEDEKMVGVFTVAFTAYCPGNSKQVLGRAKEMILLANENGRAGAWPTDDEWPALMPRWFIAASARELTDEETRAEMERQQKLTNEEKLRIPPSYPWSPLQWVSWMEPLSDEERPWYWWDAEVVTDDAIIFAIDETDDPVAVGALYSLFHAAGATRVEEIVDTTMPG